MILLLYPHRRNRVFTCVSHKARYNVPKQRLSGVILIKLTKVCLLTNKSKAD